MNDTELEQWELQDEWDSLLDNLEGFEDDLIQLEHVVDEMRISVHQMYRVLSRAPQTAEERKRINKVLEETMVGRSYYEPSFIRS